MKRASRGVKPYSAATTLSMRLESDNGNEAVATWEARVPLPKRRVPLLHDSVL